MGGERREVLFNRLVVADVGQDRIEDRQLGTAGGNRYPRLTHQRQQPDGLQCDRLASSIRPGDDELARVIGEFHIQRNERNVFRP